MIDPALPPNFREEFEELKREVRVLKSANRLHASAVQGGSFIVLDDDGFEVARVGRLFDSPVVDGLSVTSDAGIGAHLYIGGNVGVGVPWLDHGWFDPTISKTVTSGTFGEVWRCVFELNTSTVAKFRVPVATDAATTIELRVLGPGDVQLGGDKSIPGSSSSNYEFVAAHGLILQSGPITFKLQARRTAGAGDGHVYQPSPLAICGVGATPDPDGWV